MCSLRLPLRRPGKWSEQRRESALTPCLPVRSLVDCLVCHQQEVPVGGQFLARRITVDNVEENGGILNFEKDTPISRRVAGLASGFVVGKESMRLSEDSSLRV